MGKATIHFSSNGESGNIFWIICEVEKELRSQQRDADADYLYRTVRNSGSYANALQEIRRFVDLIDDDGVY